MFFVFCMYHCMLGFDLVVDFACVFLCAFYCNHSQKDSSLFVAIVSIFFTFLNPFLRHNAL